MPSCELAADRAILLGGEPALAAGADIELCVAGRTTSSRGCRTGPRGRCSAAIGARRRARRRRRRGRRRRLPAMSSTAIAGTARRRARRAPAGAPLSRRGLLLGDRAAGRSSRRIVSIALVDDVDADERRRHLDRGQRLGDRRATPTAISATARTTRSARACWLGRGDPPGAAAASPRSPTGPHERRRRGGHHGARAGQDPAEGAQVAEEGGPHGAAAARSSGSWKRSSTIARAIV